MTDDEAGRIGENVRAARRARGMSLEVAAGLIGRTKGWLSRIENGRLRLERRSDIAALAQALEVSADSLLGMPAPEIRPDRRRFSLVRLQSVLLDAAPDDPPDVRARPLPVLRAELVRSDQALCQADYTTVMQALPGVIGELCVHVATADTAGRAEALKLLIRAYGSDSTCTLRHLGETNLARVSGERAREAANLLGDPVWTGAAAFGRAHARSSANRPRALMTSPQAADAVGAHIGNSRFAREVYGMLRLSAALACEIDGDHGGARQNAAEAAQVAAPLGDSPDAWELFGPANVGVWRASLAVEAGEPGEALTYADQVEPRALASGNRRAALRVERARAHAMLDHDAQAVRELRQAERLSPQQVHNHPLVRELVADLMTRAQSRDLRGLAWRMNVAG
ncbi:XRE family transcriptional regulator [Actinomadura darangshiensis]|uniref:XRE family transcriptional regulator n=1 Tax=Actinomadura darangshiensis TaxID=705336 RepID=A0A4R4ZZ30_9ACTN|nr:helix-turn-helix transcriptional regulator [Actinomadura darangshiensis]TDD63644.1 XRE family transcriptional regulator [Actinomadura darangshiensis]